MKYDPDDELDDDDWWMEGDPVGLARGDDIPPHVQDMIAAAIDAERRKTDPNPVAGCAGIMLAVVASVAAFTVLTLAAYGAFRLVRG